MKSVKQLLEDKGHHIHAIGPGASVYDALQLMAEKQIGALVVVEDGILVGVISERDYARKVILKGGSSKKMSVKDIMTTRVVYARPDQSIQECMALMTENRVRHLPVMDDDQLAGVLSIGDLVKAIIAEQQFIIEQLEQYISR